MADPIEWPAKDPNETLKYGFNWSPRQLGSEQITSIEAEVTIGDVVVEVSSVGTVRGAKPGQGTIHWLSGGTVSETPCEIVLTAITDGGSTLEQTMSILIEEK